VVGSGGGHGLVKTANGTNGSNNEARKALSTKEGVGSSEDESIGELPTLNTQSGHSGEIHDMSHYLPLYVIPLAGLENLANLQAKVQQGDNADSTALLELAEKQIIVNVAVPQGASDEVFQMPVSAEFFRFNSSLICFNPISS
jgi:hypothetical protein